MVRYCSTYRCVLVPIRLLWLLPCTENVALHLHLQEETNTTMHEVVPHTVHGPQFYEYMNILCWMYFHNYINLQDTKHMTYWNAQKHVFPLPHCTGYVFHIHLCTSFRKKESSFCNLALQKYATCTRWTRRSHKCSWGQSGFDVLSMYECIQKDFVLSDGYPSKSCMQQHHIKLEVLRLWHRTFSVGGPQMERVL